MDGVSTEAYGHWFGERMRVESAPRIVTRALRNADIAVTEIRCDDPMPGMSGPIRHEDAFVVGLQLRDFPHREYWAYGRLASVCDLRAGETCIYDLKREPRGLLDKPYHTLFFYLPRAALDAIADEANASRIRDLSYISLARASVTSRFPASGACGCPPSVIPTKLTRCLSTTSCWRSGRISLRPNAACDEVIDLARTSPWR